MQNNNINHENNNKRNRDSSPPLFDNSIDNLFTNLPKKRNCNISSKNTSDIDLSVSSLIDSENFNSHLQNMKSLLQPNSTEIDIEMEGEASNNPPTQPSEMDRFLQYANALQDYNTVSLGDIMRGLVTVVHSQKSLDTKMSNVDTKIASLTKNVSLNTNNINILNENMTHAHDLIMQNIECTHYLKQHAIDREVFITGLSDNLNENKTLNDLCKYFNIQRNSICQHKVIPIKDHNGQPKGSFMNITFALKSDHITFMKKVGSKKQSPENERSPTPIEIAYIKKLRISRRLTHENQAVYAKLKVLENNKQIVQIRYRNCFYEFQQREGMSFVPVPSTEHLKIITKQ